MTMWSGSGSSASSLSIAGKKSSATVQQMQPLASSMIVSAAQAGSPQPFSMSASMPMSPNSLMMRARRRPLAFCRRWRIRVVLPAPRKPVTIVAGIRGADWLERLFIKSTRFLTRRGCLMRRAERTRLLRRRRARPASMKAGAPRRPYSRSNGRFPGSRIIASRRLPRLRLAVPSGVSA